MALTNQNFLHNKKPFFKTSIMYYFTLKFSINQKFLTTD